MSDNGVSGLEYIDLNLNEVEPWDGSYSRLPSGDYLFEIIKVEGGQSNAGNPKMSVTLKAIEALPDSNGNEPSEEAVKAAEKGDTAMTSYVLDKSKDVSRRRLKALTDAAGDDILDERGGFSPSDLINRRIVAECAIEEYTETDPVTQAVRTKTTNRIRRERPADEYDDIEETDDGGEPEPEPEPKEKAPAKGRGRGRRSRRAAPSR